jgi:type I restriction enzyme R subunit
MGFIRQASIGEPLKPWDERVDNALNTILALKDWTTPQKKWIEAIAKQTKATTIVDNKALDNGVLKDQQGGLRRANKLFDNDAEGVLQEFRKAIWQ